MLVCLVLFCSTVSGCSLLESDDVDNTYFLLKMLQFQCSLSTTTVSDTDMMDGTIRRVATRKPNCSATTTTTAFYKKCLQGQTYQAGSNDCFGAGNAGNDYNATTLAFCGTATNACQTSAIDYTNADPATSPAAQSCQADTTAGRTWKLANSLTTFTGTGTTISTVNLVEFNPAFPTGSAKMFWLRYSATSTTARTGYYSTNGSVTTGTATKTTALLVLCTTE